MGNSLAICNVFLFLSLVPTSYLKSILSDIRIATPSFVWLWFAWNIFSHPFTFNVFVSLDVKWVFGRQNIVGSWDSVLQLNLRMPMIVRLPLDISPNNQWIDIFIEDLPATKQCAMNSVCVRACVCVWWALLFLQSLMPGWGDKICIWEALRTVLLQVELGADCVVLIMGGQRKGSVMRAARVQSLG